MPKKLSSSIVYAKLAGRNPNDVPATEVIDALAAENFEISNWKESYRDKMTSVLLEDIERVERRKQAVAPAESVEIDPKDTIIMPKNEEE
jgi:hypothetical protein